MLTGQCSHMMISTGRLHKMRDPIDVQHSAAVVCLSNIYVEEFVITTPFLVEICCHL